MTRVRRVAGLALPVLVLSVALAMVALMISASGFDISKAAVAAIDGSFGSSFAIFSATLKRTTPILMLGLAVAVAFRAGVLNIGAEGQFLAGATAACTVGLAVGTRGGFGAIVSELGAGVLGGAAWAGVAALLKRRYAVTEVVSTLLLNFVALYLVGFLVRGPLQEPSRAYPQSAVLDPGVRLPLLVAGQRLHVGFAFALLVAVGIWWFFGATASGYRVRVTGAGRSAAASAGRVDVAAVQMWALVASGAIAGLAGACEVTGVTYALYEGLSPGYGYTAIAVALLGGLNPIGIVVSATLFGAIGAGADAMQRDAAIPAEFAAVAAALVVLGVLAAPGIQRVRLALVGKGAAR